MNVELKRRPQWKRVILSPKYFWQQMGIGRGRIRVLNRIDAALTLTWLLIRGD